MTEPTPSEVEVYRFGAFRLDLSARRLARGEEALAIPPKAFEMLRLLVLNAHRAMTRAELLDAIWRDTVVEEGSLSWNVSVLRKALDDEGGAIVQTVRGYGYRLGLPVIREVGLPAPQGASQEALAASDRPDARSTAEALPSHPAVERDQDRPIRRGRAPRLARRSALHATVVGAVLITVFGLLHLAGRDQPPVAAAAALPTLAVLPFENLSARSEDGWIATALAELLANELALEGGARTLPGESVAAATRDLGLRAGSGISPESIARLRGRLGFDQVVSGSYLVVGEPPAVRVDLRLQSRLSADPPFVWSKQAGLAELPRLVSEAGHDLRRQFAGGVRPGSASSTALELPTEVLRLYAEGLELFRQYQPAAARARLEEVVARAPDFVAGRAALAAAYDELGFRGRALDETRRALAGAGALPPAERLPIEARNLELDGRWAESAAKWREVADLLGGALEPSLARARAESRAGRHDVARALLDGLAARPAPVGSDPRIVLARGWVERFGQRFEAMRAAGLRAIEIGRSLPSDFVLAEALSLTAWADLTLGAYEDGLARCAEGEQLAARIGHARMRAQSAGLCGWLEFNLGESAKAEAWFERSLAMARDSGESQQQAGALRALSELRRREGRLARAIELQRSALALSRASGLLEDSVNSLVSLAHLEARRGALVEAEELAVEAVARARAINVAIRIAQALEVYGMVRRLRGDTAGGLAALDETVRVAPEMPAERLAIFALELARAELAAGRFEPALARTANVESSLASEPESNPQRLRANLLAARIEAALGRTASARERLGTVERGITALPDHDLDLTALLDRAELLAALGDTSAAEHTWQQIVAEPRWPEDTLARLLARYRLAAARAAREATPATTAALAAAEDAARRARVGSLLGERL